jgi:hypothetical protein
VVSEETPGPVAQDDHVRDVRPLARLYASELTHRLTPAPVALAIVAAVGPGVRQLRNGAERRAAEHFMKDLLLYTSRASEAPALARRYLRE